MVFRPTWEEFQVIFVWIGKNGKRNFIFIEFLSQNFSAYIEYMESQGAHKAGLVKVYNKHKVTNQNPQCSKNLLPLQVIPPKEWVPRKSGYDIDKIDLTIPAPITQIVSGKQGLYQQINVQRRAMSLSQFAELANSERYSTPPHFDYADLERKYWKNVTYVAPIYAADVSGKLFN